MRFCRNCRSDIPAALSLKGAPNREIDFAPYKWQLFSQNGFPAKELTSFDKTRYVRYNGHARQSGGTGGTVIGLTPNDRSGGARAA
jgi:hypothetical protein